MNWARQISLRSMAILGMLWLVGCGTVQDHRARQQATVFQEWPQETQARVLAGEIAVGDSPLMVYVALGSPQLRREGGNGEQEWIYWGIPQEITADQNDSIRFISHADTRFHRSRDLRALHLSFQHDRLVGFHLADPDPAHAFPSSYP